MRGFAAMTGLSTNLNISRSPSRLLPAAIRETSKPKIPLLTALTILDMRDEEQRAMTGLAVYGVLPFMADCNGYTVDSKTLESFLQDRLHRGADEVSPSKSTRIPLEQILSR